MNKEQHIIGQGTYGCVFKPGFTCKGNSTKQKNMITKIQRKESTSENEEKIGKKIKAIYYYSDYFAPILSSCSISLAEINKEEIKKCEFINEKIVENEKTQKKPTEKYESNKMKYIGKRTLQESIMDKYFKNSKYIPFYILRTHDHLLSGLYKLAINNIIHFDIKENNIICNDKTGNPIIIDFGLSMDTNKPNIFYEIKYFSDPYYSPWPIEVALIYFYLNHPDKQITKEFIEETIDHFLEQTKTKNLLYETEKNIYKQNLFSYYQGFLGNSMKELYEDSIKYNKTWDNYSLTWTYLNILKNIFFLVEETNEETKEKTKQENILKTYRDFLVSILLSTPDKRPTSDSTQIQLNTLFKEIPLKDLTTMQTKLNTDKSIHKEEIQSNVIQYTIYQLETEKQVFENRNSKKHNKFQ